MLQGSSALHRASVIGKEKKKKSTKQHPCPALMNTWGNTQGKCDFLRDRVMNTIRHRPFHTHHYSAVSKRFYCEKVSIHGFPQ